MTAHYKRFVEKAGRLGLVNARDLDLDQYVTDNALDGLYFMIAEEERCIRDDPVARTTERLKKVFQ